MNNIYASSSSNEEPSVHPKKFGILFWLIAVGATFLAFCLGLIGTFVVTRFAELFVSFGADLPATTLLIVEGRHFLWFSFVATVALWLFCWLSPSRYKWRNRITTAFFLIGVLSISFYPFVIWALYLPIFKMGVGVS